MKSRHVAVLLAAFATICLIPSVRAVIPIPTPEPGNPEYLVRVVYVIPTDRMLDYTIAPDCPGVGCPLYTTKVDTTVRRIQTSLEAMNDFVERSIEIFALPFDPATPGRRLNFERDNNGTGQIRVLVINGTLPTKATSPTPSYWGDTVGSNGGGMMGNVLVDVLGYPWTPYTQKTTFLFVPDIQEWENCPDPPTCAQISQRGFVGLGGSHNASSGGWGGIGMHSAGHIFTPAADDPSFYYGRQIAFENDLCSTTISITRPDDYTGVPRTWTLSKPANRGDLAQRMSGSLGPMWHELMHGFGIGHGGLTPLPWYVDIMGGGHGLTGMAIAEMYGLDCSCAYPYGAGTPHTAAPATITIGQQETAIGVPYSHYLAYSPYANPVTHPDKTDPIALVAYPPHGHVWSAPGPYELTIGAEELSGFPVRSGLNAAYLGEGSGLWSYAKFPTDGISAPSRTKLRWSGSQSGATINYGVSVNDIAGNNHNTWISTFRPTTSVGTGLGNVLWVRPDGDPRNGSYTKGTYQNAYNTSEIQTAINAAPGAAKEAVAFGNGVYPITTTIRPRIGVSLIGESMGGAILDGQGNASLDLLVADVDNLNYRLINSTITNLTFVNARRGIANNPIMSYNSYNFAIVNCVFYGMTQAAIDLRHLDLNTRILQNTVVNCQSGILLSDYTAPAIVDNPDFRFDFYNNLVVHQSGTGTNGIRLQDINTLLPNSTFIGWEGRTGYNLAHGFTNNFTGNTYPGGGLPGDISAAVTFNFSAPYYYRLAAASRGVNEGDILTDNIDGTRRDIGAFINTNYVPTPTPTPTPTPVPTPTPTPPPCLPLVSPTPTPTPSPTPTPPPPPNSAHDWASYS